MTWRVDGSRARLKAESIAGTFDLANPTGGIHEFELHGMAIPTGRFLAIRVPERAETDPPIDAYVRGDDLVAKYPPRSRDLVSHHVYYRELTRPSGIELVLSAQTSLLDSEPCTEVFNSIGPGELLAKRAADQQCFRITASADYAATMPPQFFLMRPDEHADVSLVLFVHPKDFFRAHVRIEPPSSISYWVFPNTLEKGVIRRALFQVRVVPRDGDDSMAAVLLDRATNAAPPLAT